MVGVVWCGECVTTYGLALELFLVLGHAAQPAPAGQAAAGGVEEVEAVAVADARHLAEEAATAVEARGDVVDGGDAAQVGLVEGQQTHAEGGGGRGGDPVVRDGEVVAGAVPRRIEPRVGMVWGCWWRGR